MKRTLILTVVVLTLGLSSCQCAEKPDIGPVEDEEDQSTAQVAPSTAPAYGMTGNRL